MNPTLEADYTRRCAGYEHMDIHEHLSTLSGFASHCETIVEFGTRTGNSTCALLHGLESNGKGAGVLYSYDINPTTYKPPLDMKTGWLFTVADTRKLDDIPACDLLFVDTLHTADQVRAELKHAGKVKWWIILHDTVTFGDNGEMGQTGITRAIYEFLRDNPNWKVAGHWDNNNGLLALSRTYGNE